MLNLRLGCLTNDLLRKVHSGPILLLTKWLDPTKHPHVTFKGYQLLLLNLPYLLILEHVGLHILEAGSVFLNFLFESLIFLFDGLEVLLFFFHLLEYFLYVS